MDSKIGLDIKGSTTSTTSKSLKDTYDAHNFGEVTEIDTKKEAEARRKFDIYVLPVSVIFLVLSALNRNNISNFTHIITSHILT